MSELSKESNEFKAKCWERAKEYLQVLGKEQLIGLIEHATHEEHSNKPERARKAR